MVAVLRAGFFEGLASGFFDSIWAKLKRSCFIRSGAPFLRLVVAGRISTRFSTCASIILPMRSWYRVFELLEIEISLLSLD
jgi:hypothetical protein